MNVTCTCRSGGSRAPRRDESGFASSGSIAAPIRLMGSLRLRGRGFRRVYKGLLLALVTLWLAACAPASHPGAAELPKDSPVVAPAPAPTPEPARRVPEELLTSNGVYYGCNVPADCEVKNVGNCCGHYPACVNKGSPTFPDKVKADCAAGGMSSICGFPSISSCDCVEGRCTAITGPSADPAQSVE